MSDEMGLAVSLSRQVALCHVLVAAAERQGYLINPGYVNEKGHGAEAFPWTTGRLLSSTRGWLGGFYETWCKERSRWPLVLWASIVEGETRPVREAAHSLRFSTPKTLKWNGINAPLLLLSGGASKTGNRINGAGITCHEMSARYDVVVRRPEICRAVFAILDLPANQAFLTGGNTLGRR